MIRDLGNIERRLTRLERESGGDVMFIMPDGTVQGMRAKDTLSAVDDAVFKRPSRNGYLMLNAVHVRGAGHLHELARALACGPVDNNAIHNRKGELR